MRVRVALFTLAGIALILAAAAFLFAVQANSRNVTVAVNDARSAAADAKAAAAQAQQAEAQVAKVHVNLCAFLHVIATTDHQDVNERAEAGQLYVLYKCAAG